MFRYKPLCRLSLTSTKYSVRRHTTFFAVAMSSAQQKATFSFASYFLFGTACSNVTIFLPPVKIFDCRTTINDSPSILRDTRHFDSDFVRQVIMLNYISSVERSLRKSEKTFPNTLLHKKYDNKLNDRA